MADAALPTELVGEIAKQGLLGIVASIAMVVAWSKDRDCKRKDREIRVLGDKMLKLALEQVQVNERFNATITSMKETVARVSTK